MNNNNMEENIVAYNLEVTPEVVQKWRDSLLHDPLAQERTLERLKLHESRHQTSPDMAILKHLTPLPQSTLITTVENYGWDQVL